MNIKENKAITLIALVVTIIILIILAGISLNLVLGEHGLITLAKKAKENMELAQIQEQEELNQLYEQLYNGGGSSGGLEPAGQEIKEDNYGEYVDYGLDINGNEDTTDDWRIFYTNDEGRIFLIAADYVPTTCDAITDAINENHANMVTSVNYRYYWSSSSPATYHCNDGHNTTLNQSKAQCSFPELFMPSGNFCSSENHYYCSDHVGTGTNGNINSQCASALQCTDNWKSFVENSKKSTYAAYAIGGPTLEMWIASWNKVHGASTETNTERGITLYANGNSNSGRGYYVGTTEQCTTTSYNLSKTEGYNDKLYFPDKTNDRCNGYWLASPSAYGRNILLYVSYYGNVSCNDYSSSYFGVRPVVCLKSGVKLVKSTDKSTDTKTVYDLYSNNGNSGSSGNTGGNSGTGGSGLTGDSIKREYVDYGLDINNNGDTTDDWSAFYTNDDGRIFLIAADYVPKTCNALITAIDASHANMTADSENYQTYHWDNTKIPTYRCNDGHNKTLNNTKAQCSFPNLFMPSGDFCSSFYCSDHVGNDGTGGYINSRCASALQCTDNWSSFVTQSTKKQYADYAIGGPTLEMWVASWNKVHGTNTEVKGKKGITLYANGNNISLSNSVYGYYVGNTKDCLTGSFPLRDYNGYNDPLYFPHQTMQDLNLDNSGGNNDICYGYWIASPLASNEFYLMGVRCSGGIEHSAYTAPQYYGVRPVVCLKSGVKLTKNDNKSNNEKIVYDLSM